MHQAWTKTFVDEKWYNLTTFSNLHKSHRGSIIAYSLVGYTYHEVLSSLLELG